MPPTQVVAVQAAEQPVAETLSLVGTLAANESVEIQSEVDGVIDEIPFGEGDSVEKGQLLVQLEETKLRAAFEEAKANYELTKSNYNRSEELYQDSLISSQEFDQAMSSFQRAKATMELRERNLRDARIFAPFDGVVGSREVSPGQVINKNTTLTWLVDLDPIKVEINVPEKFLGQLSAGQTLDLTVAAFPEETFAGRVYFIAPFVDPVTRTALVKARIDNPDFRLKPGMFATLDLTLKIREKAVVVPEAAINQVLQKDRANLFVVTEENTVELREVRVGVRMPGQIEILEGLKVGERVVVEGTQKIGPGASVTLAPPKSTEPYRFEETEPLSRSGLAG